MYMTFNELTRAARYNLASAVNDLTNEKSGISALAGDGDLERVSIRLTWYAERWMAASQKYDWALYAAKALELALIEVLNEAEANAISHDDPGVEEALDQRAINIVKEMAVSVTYDLMTERGTFQGINALEEKIKRDTLRWVLEALCGMSNRDIAGAKAMDDITTGIFARKQERDRVASLRVTKIKYYKAGGTYRMEALNNNGDELFHNDWNKVVTRKSDALTLIASVVANLQQSQGLSRIEVVAD